MAETTHTVRMTYRQLAEHFGIGVDSARIKATRHVRAGRWKLIPGNFPGAVSVVELPTEHLKAPSAPERTPTPRSSSAPPVAPPADAVLAAELERARAELRDEQQDRAVEREGWRITIDQLTATIDRLQAAHADKLAELREAHVAELERLDAEFERQQADRQAERERIRELVAKLIDSTTAREGELRSQAEAAERRADLEKARANSAQEAAAYANDETAKVRAEVGKQVVQIERLTATLDRLHKDRDTEVEEHAAVMLERDTMARELERARRPWWRRVLRR